MVHGPLVWTSPSWRLVSHGSKYKNWRRCQKLRVSTRVRGECWGPGDVNFSGRQPSSVVVKNVISSRRLQRPVAQTPVDDDLFCRMGTIQCWRVRAAGINNNYREMTDCHVGVCWRTRQTRPAAPAGISSGLLTAGHFRLWWSGGHIILYNNCLFTVYSQRVRRLYVLIAGTIVVLIIIICIRYVGDNNYNRMSAQSTE